MDEARKKWLPNWLTHWNRKAIPHEHEPTEEEVKEDREVTKRVEKVLVDLRGEKE